MHPYPPPVFNFNTIKKIWRSDITVSDTDEISRLIQSNPLLDDLMKLQDTSMAVLDISTWKYVGIWGDLEKLLGWEKEVYFDKGVEFYVSTFLPADFLGFQIVSKATNDYVAALPVNDRHKVRIIFDYRLQRKDGAIVRIRQESLVLKSDDQGRILYYLALISDISHLKNDGKQHFSFINGDDKELYEIDHQTNTYKAIKMLSRREMEIIRLIGQNYTSEQISRILFISPNTVDTHRQKILKKVGVESTADLLNLFRIFRIM